MGTTIQGLVSNAFETENPSFAMVWLVRRMSGENSDDFRWTSYAAKASNLTTASWTLDVAHCVVVCP